VSRDRNIYPPAVAKDITGEFDRLVVLHLSQQNSSQPACIAAPKIKQFAEQSGLVPAARMGGIKAIILDLAGIENRSFAVWQSRHTRHRKRRRSSGNPKQKAAAESIHSGFEHRY
jgi:hypothetical protein